MLIPDFYTVSEINTSDSEITVILSLNPDHKVYNGHFPGQPVFPGVIQVQMVKEMVEQALEEELVLKEMPSAKYLQMIIPDKSDSLKLKISYSIAEEDLLKVSAMIGSLDGQTCTRLKLHLKRRG